MTLLLDKKSKPGTHAIVIGIGRYPWLVGGKGKPRFPQHDGMTQLTSPPASARAFATWLLETYENPGAPLASLDLLLSDAKGQKFKGANGEVEVEPATFANVSEAIKAWAKRSTREQDVLMLFFSGHGISAAVQTTLLCEDYGKDKATPLSFAIDFNKLHIGLDKFPARFQCFFVDACRVATSNILESFNFYGQPVIDPTSAHNPKRRKAPVFQSTLAGQLAYGQKGKPSYFTAALLRGFEGAGSDNDQDGLTWWVQTVPLLRAMPQLLQRVVKDPDEVLQEASAAEAANFPFHRLKQRPVGIPVDVSCVPDSRTAKAVLSYSGVGPNEKSQRTKTSAKPWQLDLAEGRYTFEAAVASPKVKGKVADEAIRPPYRNIRIKV
jgi:Caspase domain